MVNISVSPPKMPKIPILGHCGIFNALSMESKNDNNFGFVAVTAEKEGPIRRETGRVFYFTKDSDVKQISDNQWTVTETLA